MLLSIVRRDTLILKTSLLFYHPLQHCALLLRFYLKLKYWFLRSALVLMTVWGFKLPSVATYWLCYNSREAYGGKSASSWFILLWDLSTEPSWSVCLSPLFMCLCLHLCSSRMYDYFKFTVKLFTFVQFGYFLKFNVMIWKYVNIFFTFHISLNVFYLYNYGATILTWHTFIEQFGWIKSDYWFNFFDSHNV